jgi:hypothetical protein
MRRQRRRHALGVLEVGLHGGRALVTLGGIAPERAEDDLLGLARDLRVQPARRGRITHEPRAADHEGIVVAEGRRARQQLVEDGADAVDVGAGAAGSAQDLLRRDIARRADRRRSPRQPEARRRGHVREAEVDEADRAVGTQDDVRGLDVVVNDAAAVDVIERGAHAAADGQRLGLGQSFMRVKVLRERSPRHVLGDDVGATLVGRERHEAEHEGVIEPATDLLLALEERPGPDAAREQGQRYLDRDDLASPREILRLEDRRHAPASQLLGEPEAAIEDLSFLGSRPGHARRCGAPCVPASAREDAPFLGPDGPRHCELQVRAAGRPAIFHLA